MIWKWFLLVFLIDTYSFEELQLNFFQNDYDMKMDIAECSLYNKSLIKFCNASFVPHNRTQRVFNETFQLLVDMGRDGTVDVQAYKMVSNEYRFFPLSFAVNGCDQYNKNAFGLKDTLSRTSNVNPCNLKKVKGIYYIKNALPDFSRFPPRMPRGSYKITAKLLFYSALCIQVDYYVRIVDKPIDWMKIPKSKRYQRR